MMFTKKRGVAIIWLGVLVGIFVVGLMYTIFSQVLYGYITPTFYPQLDAIDNTTSGVNTTAMHTTINLLNLVWTIFPLIFVFALILYGFMASQRKGYEVSYQ